LGYYPFKPPETLADRLLACRRHLGLSRRAMAQRLSVDEGTLAHWERGDRQPSEPHRRAICALADKHVRPFYVEWEALKRSPMR
jgi:DNA-binding transcriptional regulator YiaG